MNVIHTFVFFIFLYFLYSDIIAHKLPGMGASTKQLICTGPNSGCCTKIPKHCFRANSGRDGEAQTAWPLLFHSQNLSRIRWHFRVHNALKVCPQLHNSGLTTSYFKRTRKQRGKKQRRVANVSVSSLLTRLTAAHWNCTVCLWFVSDGNTAIRAFCSFLFVCHSESSCRKSGGHMAVRSAHKVSRQFVHKLIK